MKKLLSLLLLALGITLQAQEMNMPKLNVYLDCISCDMDYLQQEMRYTNFVRDQKDADVYIMVLTQKTGSGGTKYELEFSGQGQFADLFYSSGYSVDMNTTFDERREEMKAYLEMGLGNFWHYMYVKVRPYIPGDSLQVQQVEAPKVEEEKDKWNSWVFSLGLNGSFSGEETSNTNNISSNVSAKRVTEKNKFYLRASWDSNNSEYKYGTEVIKSKKEEKSLMVSDAVSIHKFWSLGAFVKAGNSIYENKDLYVSFKPGLEYSFFPYEEATKQQITLSYKVGGVYNEYIERSVFAKNSELLWEQSVDLGGSLKRKWGSVSGNASYDAYLHDRSLYAINFSLHTSVRIAKGLSFNIMSTYKITNNQINLAGGDVSKEELLLRQQQVKSGYRFFSSIGFSYSFGSMFSSVVNPRFGF